MGGWVIAKQRKTLRWYLTAFFTLCLVETRDLFMHYKGFASVNHRRVRSNMEVSKEWLWGAKKSS